MSRVLAACWLAFAAATAIAEEFVALGSRLSELDRSAYSCSADGAQMLCRANVAGTMHLDVPVLAMTLGYRDELLRGITVIFDEGHFPALESRLSARFGPGEARDERLRSGMAGALVNRIRVWRTEGRVVMLEQFFGKITRSALRYLTAEEFERLMQARDAGRTGGVRDL